MEKERSDLYCNGCKSKIRDDADFCHICGEIVLKSKVCVSCNTRLDSADRYCYKCGEKWDRDAQALMERTQKEMRSRERKKGKVFTVSSEEKKDDGIGIDFSSCFKGKHKLIEIFSQEHAFGEETVVRWCPTCGCVVVDTDFDNRTRKGKMLVPKLAKKIVYKEDVR